MPGVLDDFSARRRVLTAVAEDAARLARIWGERPIADRLGVEGEKLAAEVFDLAVMGEFERGKSTLVNAPIGADVLTTAVVPLTSVVTAVHWGTETAATVRFLDGRRERIAIERLYVPRNLVHAFSAYGIGVLGTRFGSRPVLAVGYGVFALTCLGFVLVPATASIGVLVPLFALAGLALAAEEVLEGTVAAELLPERVRGTGFGALAAVNGVGDPVASVVVGWLWAAVSPAAGFAYAAALAALGAAVLVRVR
jgi:MFS family permease